MSHQHPQTTQQIGLRDAGAHFRSIVVHVQPDADALPRLKSAIALAHDLGARLVGVGAEIAPPVSLGPTAAPEGAMFVELQALADANVRAARDLFRTQTTKLFTVWREELTESPADAMVRAASANDLIVAGGSPLQERNEYRWCDPAQLVIRSGRPVLVVPPNGGALRAAAAVVAWKNTREARRALSDALPFLRCASKTTVLQVAPEDERGDDTTEIAAWLRLHGVNATAKVVQSNENSVAAELRKEAAMIGADLIVAGGYGHSRLGEWLFGGVTIELLHEPEYFVFVSH